MAVPRAVAQTVRDRGRTTQRGRAARIRGDAQVASAEVLSWLQLLNSQPPLPPFA
jgi:hypothetical protein